MADEAIIVIGGGSAGTQAARALARAGRRVVITDPRTYGGTCIWRGCVPKKVLYTAGVMHQEQLRRGWLSAELSDPPSGDHTVDWARVRAWQRDAMHGYAGDQEGVLRDLGVQVLHAPARFRAPDVVEIDGTPYRAAHVVVATGSRGTLPDLPGKDLLDTSDQALFYDERPRSLIVVGGGYIAMELAGIYASFGASVHLLVRGRQVLAPFDADCAQVALEGLQCLGVTGHLETQVLAVSGHREGLTVRVRGQGGAERELITERVLAATGRGRPWATSTSPPARSRSTGAAAPRCPPPCAAPATLACGSRATPPDCCSSRRWPATKATP